MDKSGNTNCLFPEPWLPMTRTRLATTAATPPNRNTGDWCRHDRKQAACLSGCAIAISLCKKGNLTTSVTDRRLQVSETLPLFGTKREPGACLGPALTSRRFGRIPQMACNCYSLRLNDHRSKRRAASHDASTRTVMDVELPAPCRSPFCFFFKWLVT